MKVTIAIPLLICLLAQASTLNILGIFPYQGKSHFSQFKVYLRELTNRGHNLTVISYFPEKNPPPNYKDVQIADTKILEDDVPVHKSYLMVLACGVLLTQLGTSNCKALASSPQVQDLVNKKPKFDVIVLEQFNSDCALGIAHVLGAPVIGITSHVLMPYHYKRFGIPSHAAYVPFHFLEGGTRPNLYERVERVVFDAYFNTLFTFEQWFDQYTLSKYYEGIPSLEELARNMKLILLYQHHALTGPRVLPANVIEVGGYHVPEAKPLSGDIKKFVDGANHGLIYISFGSMIKSTTLPESKKQAILDAMQEFPQRFIWKWEDESLEYDKDKLYISKWLPQVDILANPKTLVFISHGGMGGTTEAIHYGVPTIAVPFFGDQPSNAAAVQESGFGTLLDINYMTKETLVEAIKNVLNPEFREKSKRVSKSWHDRPMSALDTAVYWTEYAARHPDATFRSAAADVPLYQHLYLDVGIVLIVLGLGYLYVMKVVVTKIFCRPKAAKDQKAERRKKQK